MTTTAQIRAAALRRMGVERMDTAVIATYRLAMQKWDNSTLAAFNNAAQGWGRIDPLCKAYQPAMDAGLIDDDGMLRAEEIKEASAAEVNHRVKSGLWT